MRWDWLLILSVGLFVTGCNRDGKDPVELDNMHPPVNRILGIHFIGSANASKDPNAAFLKGIWTLPETQTLKSNTLNKLARVPFELASRRGTASTNNFDAEIRPLLNDLVQTESWMEIRDETNQSLDFSLALKLDAGRAESWRTNIAAILSAWSGIAVTQIDADGVTGWELKKHDPPNLIRFSRAGEWIVLSAGENKISLADELMARIKSEGRPCPGESNDVLTVTANVARLAEIVPLPQDLLRWHLSSIRGRWSIGNDHVRTDIVASRDAAFDFGTTSWRIPTNSIHGPITGFTAMKGIGDWLTGHFSRLKMSPMPEQYFVWTLKALPFQGFVAAPVESASNALQQLGPQLLTLNTNPPTKMPGNVDWQTNQEMLVWTGLPYIAPFIQGLHTTNGDFLLAGVFPAAAPRTPLPQALLAEVQGQTNLVYYNWEATAERVDGWKNITQLYLIMFNLRQLDDDSASSLWIAGIKKRLGPAVTEVTQTGTNELTLTRNSSVGFTAFEMVALASWLETPKFPLDTPLAPMERPKPRSHRTPTVHPPSP